MAKQTKAPDIASPPSDKASRVSGSKRSAKPCASSSRARLGGWFRNTQRSKAAGRTDPIELQRALAACRLHQAVLVIARRDRLARNAAFLLTLRDHGVEFVATDQPGANRMTVGVLAVVAEHEAEAISVRTKAALSAAK